MRPGLLRALAAVPVLTWAAISYTLVGSLIDAMREEPRTAAVAILLWFAISVLLLLIVRRLWRSAAG